MRLMHRRLLGQHSLGQQISLAREFLKDVGVTQMFQASRAEPIVRCLVVSFSHVLDSSFYILLYAVIVLRGEPALCHLGIGEASESRHLVDSRGFDKGYFVETRTRTRTRTRSTIGVAVGVGGLVVPTTIIRVSIANGRW